MGKFRDWASRKFRSGEKDKESGTQPTFTSAGVQKQIQGTVNNSAQSASKKPTILKLRTPERRAQAAIRKHKNDVEDALKWAVHASDHEIVSCLLSMPQLHKMKVETYEDCLEFAVAHSAPTCKLLFAHAWNDSNPYRRIPSAAFFTKITEAKPEMMDDWLECLKENDKLSLLRAAVQSDRLATVQWLLKNGAINNGFENIILPLAVRNSKLEMVELLVNHGADIDATADIPITKGYNALLMAANHGLVHKVRFLLDRGADMSTTDPSGRTALHLAANNNHVEVVRILLDRGASHVAKTKLGQQSIHLAGENGNKTIFNMLREHAGLPPVTGSVHYPGYTSNYDGPSSPHLSPLCNSGILWPNRVQKDRTTGQRYTLEPSDPAYWN
jgi:hypothetical protein